MSARNLKTRPRDYQKWIRSVRFTPRGSQKKELGRFDTLGAFRGFGGFGQAECRGRHADFVHFVDFLYIVHFVHMADFADFTVFGSEM